jgi:two-component system OmpR family response regulator
VRVLLVEDSKVLAERLSDAIRETGDTRLVGVADTETAAVEAAKRQVIDVIILDLHLREGTGFGVLRALANEKRRPTIIVLTNYDLPEYKEAALALGATYFLDKACDYPRIPALLHQLADARPSPH